MLGTMGALWGVSQLVNRDTAQRAYSKELYYGKAPLAAKTVVSDSTLAAERPMPSTDTDELFRMPTSTEGNPMDLIESTKRSDDFLFRGNDPVFPSAYKPQYRTNQKKFYLPKQEREMLPDMAVMGNARQTTPLVANKQVLDRNPIPKQKSGAMDVVGSATGVNAPDIAWDIQNIYQERNKVQNSKLFTPYRDACMPIRQVFAKPNYHFAPVLRNAPTFLEPRRFDRHDSKINRPTINYKDEVRSSGRAGLDQDAIAPSRDREYTQTGVMYRRYPCRTAIGVQKPQDMLIADKPDSVMAARNPGPTRTDDQGRFYNPASATGWRRKLEDFTHRCLSVPHVPFGQYAQPNGASKLFSTYRKKRDDTVAPKPMVGKKSMADALAHPQVHTTTRKSTRQLNEPTTMATQRYTAPANYSDRWLKPAAKGVSDLKGNRN